MKIHKMTEKPLSRRGFLGSSLAAVSVLKMDLRGLLRQAAAPAGPEAKVNEYRMLGRTGFKVSDIGFGAGYLSNANVLSAALDRGVNYIDTAESYERGASERTIGEAIKNRDRRSLFITTKMWLGSRQPKDKDGIKERFRKCLERMKTGYADCLMIHLCSLADVKHEPYHEAMLADYRELSSDLYCRHACGMCESACPRGIPVNSIMRYAYYFKAKKQEKTVIDEYAVLRSRNAATCRIPPAAAYN